MLSLRRFSPMVCQDLTLLITKDAPPIVSIDLSPSSLDDPPLLGASPNTSYTVT